MFFALNTLKHVKSLVLPPMMQVYEYPTSDRVTWHYFQVSLSLSLSLCVCVCVCVCAGV